jgi:hypothetical protein
MDAVSLIPCRPSAFDLAAIQTSAKLVQLLRKPPSSSSPPARPTRRVSIRKQANW